VEYLDSKPLVSFGRLAIEEEIYSDNGVAGGEGYDIGGGDYAGTSVLRYIIRVMQCRFLRFFPN